MKKAELLARIEALEARLRVLEARPQYYWPAPQPWWVTNPLPSMSPTWVPQTVEITCGSAFFDYGDLAWSNTGVGGHAQQ